MEELAAAVARLFGVFTDPVNVLLLLIVFAEAFGLYKFAQFFMQRYDKEIDSRTQLANALNGLTKAVQEDEK